MSRERSGRVARRTAVAVAQAGFFAMVASQASAVEATWDLLRPSNSGIPGEEIRRVTFTPGGEL